MRNYTKHLLANQLPTGAHLPCDCKIIRISEKKQQQQHLLCDNNEMAHPHAQHRDNLLDTLWWVSPFWDRFYNVYCSSIGNCHFHAFGHETLVGQKK